MTALLTLAMIAAPPSARDLMWSEVMVDQVIAFGPVRSLEHVLPRREAYLLRSLGCSQYSCRQLAREALEDLGAGAVEALAFGTHVLDPEITESSRRLLDRLYACPKLNGESCAECGGSGDRRLRQEWVEGEPVYVERNLFGRTSR